jgi:hypothetical protein
MAIDIKPLQRTRRSHGSKVVQHTNQHHYATPDPYSVARQGDQRHH